MVENFTLEDFVGKSWSLEDFRDHKLVVAAFMGVECPLAKLYSSRLVEMAGKYEALGVAFVAINSNQQDSLAEIAHHARTHKIDFPVLKDPGNVVADQFGAERTPEVFVLDEERKVRYHGCIDDQYGYGTSRPAPKEHFLAVALDALLAGQSPHTPETPVAGCHIGRVFKQSDQPPQDAVTYSRQISRILQKHCVECHRPGEIGPFALLDYDEVVGWAEMIAEVVREERMPPWHASPDHGKFINDARLSQEEKDQIIGWVESGAPQGDESELPPPRQFVEGWRIGEPDLVINMRDKPFQVPARGEVRYQYFVVDPGFTEDKWVQAAECRPGNRSVVHHILVGLAPDSEHRAEVHGLRSSWITATAPGARPLQLRDGYAKLIPAGSRLVFQMHYTPNGTEQEDLSCVGFKFADPATVKKQVVTQDAANSRFQIPPGAEEHEVESSYTFARDSIVLRLFPHMHLRGKSFTYTAKYPDGTSEILLDVPRYDFNWQNGYEPVEPKKIPAGTVIHCRATFDNSENNLSNPDPNDTVRWGDQTWEEMMIGYFDMAIADQDLTKPSPIETGTRAQAFQERAAAGEIDPDALFAAGELKELAAQALSSNESLEKFAAKLREIAPQLDRVCWTTVRDGQLTVAAAAQAPELEQTLGGHGVTVEAERTGLAECAAAGTTTVHQRLSRQRRPDLRFMSRRLAASAHVPVSGEFGPGTINFWSTEEDAFGPEAVSLLERAVREMTSR